MKFKHFLLVWVLFFSTSLLWSNDDIRRNIVDTAKKYVGIPYLYGSESPRGFDCSGFVRFVYRTAAEIELPRSAKSIWANGQMVRVAAGRPGDILVFDTVGRGNASHVAILLDNETMIHAVSEGPYTGVVITSLRDKYFSSRLMGMRSYILSPVALKNE